MSECERTSTVSPASISSLRSGVFSSDPRTFGCSRPARIRSQRGRNRRLSRWYLLNTMIGTPRTSVARVMFPLRTSSTYWRGDHHGSEAVASEYFRALTAVRAAGRVAAAEQHGASGAAPKLGAGRMGGPCVLAPPLPGGHGAVSFGRGDWLEPFVLPVERTARLAATVSRAIAMQAFEVRRGVHRAQPGPVDAVTGLVRGRAHNEGAAAERRHLRHERQGIEGAVGTKCRGDLLGALDPHEFADGVSTPTRHDQLRVRLVKRALCD